MIARRLGSVSIAAAIAGLVAFAPASAALADDDDVGSAGVSVTIPAKSGTGGAGGGSGGSGAGAGGSAGTAGPGAPTPAPGSICSITEWGEPVAPAEPVDTEAVAILDRPGYAAGDPVIASAGGYQPGQQVQFVLYSEPVVVADGLADETGTVTAGFAVPADTPPGPHRLQLTGWNCGAVASATLVVSAMPDGEEATAASWWLLGAGLALLVSITLLLIGLRGGWFTQVGLGQPS